MQNPRSDFPLWQHERHIDLPVVRCRKAIVDDSLCLAPMLMLHPDVSAFGAACTPAFQAMNPALLFAKVMRTSARSLNRRCPWHRGYFRWLSLTRLSHPAGA